MLAAGLPGSCWPAGSALVLRRPAARVSLGAAGRGGGAGANRARGQAGATGTHSLGDRMSQSVYQQWGVMAGLVILGVIAAIVLLYAADRAVQARARARRLRSMSERLAAAAVRAEKQQATRQAADAASAELTSVMPAINLRLPVTPPGQTADGDAPQDWTGCGHRPAVAAW